MKTTTTKKLPGETHGARAQGEPSRRMYDDDLEPFSPYNLEKRTKVAQLEDLQRIQCERKLTPPGRRIA